jgi:hypothetical protein
MAVPDRRVFPKRDIHVRGVGMAELSRSLGKHAMNMIAHINTRRGPGLALGIIAVVMAHLSVATDAGRFDEPWPALFSTEPISIDPGFALLHQRANGSLQRLVQPGREPAPL